MFFEMENIQNRKLERKFIILIMNFPQCEPEGGKYVGRKAAPKWKVTDPLRGDIVIGSSFRKQGMVIPTGAWGHSVASPVDVCVSAGLKI